MHWVVVAPVWLGGLASSTTSLAGPASMSFRSRPWIGQPRLHSRLRNWRSYVASRT